jgi:hypothetical protein
LKFLLDHGPGPSRRELRLLEGLSGSGANHLLRQSPRRSDIRVERTGREGKPKDEHVDPGSIDVQEAAAFRPPFFTVGQQETAVLDTAEVS